MDQSGEAFAGAAKVFFNNLFDISRSYQSTKLAPQGKLMENIRAALEKTPQIFPSRAVVACQGVEGAYSELACEKLFSTPEIVYFRHFEGVFQSVQSGLCQFGVLPIENSSYGSVAQVYDLMKKYQFHIVRSIKVLISHTLLAKPGTKMNTIREVFSHEQAIGQCSEFLRAHKEIKVTVCENTAIAARMVAESERDDVAAISSRNCAELYGLSVLSDDVQNQVNNYTRFICISRDLQIYPGSNKISLIVSVAHRPGALYELLSRFSVLDLNLTKLESRPIPGMDFEYMFYFDFDASVYSDDVIQLLSLLESEPGSCVFLGSYSEV